VHITTVEDDDNNFYKEEDPIITVKYINISNFARRMAHCERCVTIIIMDACRDVNTDPRLLSKIDDSESPVKDLPTS
jgi:hypothetical protein